MWPRRRDNRFGNAPTSRHAIQKNPGYAHRFGDSEQLLLTGRY